MNKEEDELKKGKKRRPVDCSQEEEAHPVNGDSAPRRQPMNRTEKKKI